MEERRFTMSNILIHNKKARHLYSVLETCEIGLVLQGSEIKALREHGGGLDECFARFEKGELWLYGFHIARFSKSSLHYTHEENRPKKGLMHRRMLGQWALRQKQDGLTLVPLDVHLTRGRAKMTLALAKGLKKYDKRQKIKERESARAMQRVKG